MALASSAIAGYLVLAYVAYSVLKFVIAGLTNPRRHIPGPWHTNYTGFYASFLRVMGVGTDYLQALHVQYGPVVRFTPSMISVADSDSWAHICRMGSGFHKSVFYETAKFGPAHAMFTMTDPRQHTARRKLFARAFTLESLRKHWEAPVRELAELAVRQIKRDAETGVADIYKWWRLMAGDVIGLLSFGETFHMLEDGKKTPFFRALVNIGLLSVLRDVLPFPPPYLRYILPFKAADEILSAYQVIHDQGTIAVETVRSTKGRPSLFSNVVAEADADEGEKSELTDDAIRAEAAVFMVAGSDTTAFALTYTVWCILRRPELQRKIELEVAQLPASFTDKDVEALSVLNNAMEETARLYNAAQALLPRTVPKGGATFSGYFLPEGSIVGAQHMSLALVPELFEDPETFDETRWENPTPQQKRSAQPFSLGARNCIGQHLAKLEMRLALALFFRELRGARMGKDMTDDMMEVRTKFLGYPKGEKCEITLLDSEAE